MTGSAARRESDRSRSSRSIACATAIACSWLIVGCNGLAGRHEIQSDNRVQVLLSDESQVKVRNAQSRVFDTVDRRMMIQAIVATYQDLGFQIAVLDEDLGIVSGKRYENAERPSDAGLVTYLLYDDESLVVFNRVYRTWGPFQARSDMVRLTTTVRQRNAEQLIVRTSAQFYLRPIEAPDAYQKFYAALEQVLFSERAKLDAQPLGGAEGASP